MEEQLQEVSPMSVSVEIPADVQPLVAAAVAEGRYANEQELVSEILRLAVPALKGHEQMRRDHQDLRTIVEKIFGGSA